MRIFLDANILFSAAKSDGAIRHLVGLMIDARHECCVDGFVVEEARRNLAAKAPGAMASLHGMLSRCNLVPILPGDSGLEAALPLPEKDRPVLGAAIRSGCAALLTGDRTHFGRLYGKVILGVAIHSPRSLAEALGFVRRGSGGDVVSSARGKYQVRRVRAGANS